MEVELKKLQQEVTPEFTATLTDLYAHNAQTFISPSPTVPFPPLSKYFVSAVMPGFNQLASDLAHQRLLELSLVQQLPHMAFDLEWMVGWLDAVNKVDEFRA